MLTADQINDLHRLYWSERWPIRKIERHLHLSWRTIKKYLDAPAQSAAPRQRESKLDPFKPTIAELLDKDPTATAAVIQQRLRSVGYDGAYTILREYVRATRVPSHGTAGRGTLRGRLGALRRTRLRRRQTQAICLRPGGIA